MREITEKLLTVRNQTKTRSVSFMVICARLVKKQVQSAFPASYIVSLHLSRSFLVQKIDTFFFSFSQCLYILANLNEVTVEFNSSSRGFSSFFSYSSSFLPFWHYSRIFHLRGTSSYRLRDLAHPLCHISCVNTSLLSYRSSTISFNSYRLTCLWTMSITSVRKFDIISAKTSKSWYVCFLTKQIFECLLVLEPLVFF